MTDRQKLLSRAALGDPKLAMHVEIHRVHLRIERIAVIDGSIVIFLADGSSFSSDVLERLKAKIHILSGSTYLKLRICNGELVGP